MLCEENLLKQAQLIKRNNTLKGQKIWIYRNPVLAMPWMTSTRKLTDNPEYDSWFLRFRKCSDGRDAEHCESEFHNSVCDHTYSPPKCSNLFHSQIQTMEGQGQHAEGLNKTTGEWTKYSPPDGQCNGKSCDCGRVPCGFYLFNHTSTEVINGQTLRQWFVENMFITDTGLNSEAVDGFFIDDYWPLPNPAASWPPPPSHGRNGNIWGGGAGDLDGTEISDCALSKTDATNLYHGWVRSMKPIIAAVLNNTKKPGFVWQMMNGGTGLWAEVAGYTGTGHWSFREPRPDNKTCIELLRDGCRADSKQQTGTFNYIPPTNHSNLPNFHNQTLVMQSFKEHLAAFLLMRGPFAYFGYGWVGCSQIYTRPKELDADYGVPLG
jgi:hypothetical protein